MCFSLVLSLVDGGEKRCIFGMEDEHDKLDRHLGRHGLLHGAGDRAGLISDQDLDDLGVPIEPTPLPSLLSTTGEVLRIQISKCDSTS